MQTGNGCFFKKTGHQKKDCRKYEEWKKKNPNWKKESTNQSLFSVITVEKQDIFDGNAEERSRIMEE